jgi:Asp-tRNA(Asn)/Glu-tRNA(Gln) amidotransferase A subunit family amidase
MGRLQNLQNLLRNKKISLSEYYRDLLKTAKDRNQKTNALIEIFEEDFDKKLVNYCSLKFAQTAFKPKTFWGIVS